ncbi:hypothetical protein [Chryseobacterium turcicum]|uniref:Uncharacterized protein n=1 Tax=Chryseobacterium turcicum TaxID=2898076 RepID=A0A9Q3YUT3_9FLAO|nr:hypothetical protein [Chryseobacterium turcicum]MCD1116726.1 hypothetical protein [Chryseobacterium turcicum]
MKKLVLAMALMSLSTLAYSQEKKEKSVKVPDVVEKSFQKAYPTTKAEWEKKTENLKLLSNTKGRK